MRRTPLTVTASVVACALASVFALTACAPDAPGADPSASPTGSARPTASASPTPTPSASASADAECLIGTWTMDQAGMDQFYGDINELLAGAGVTFTPQGSATLTLGADGAFTWAPSADVTAAVSGTDILVTLGGQITGTYTATGDHVSTTAQSAEALTVTATIDGAETDPGSISEQIAGAPVTDASYVCSADTLTLETAISGGTATSVLHRG